MNKIFYKKQSVDKIVSLQIYSMQCNAIIHRSKMLVGN